MLTLMWTFVVNERSGCLDLSDQIKKYPLAKTHFNMNKFGKPTEEDFLLVQDVVEEMMENARDLLSSRRTAPVTGTDSIAKWLSPVDPKQLHEKIAKTRATGSGTWFFERQTFKHWYLSDNSTFLWLRGISPSLLCLGAFTPMLMLAAGGAGKTTLMYVIQWRANSEPTSGY